MCINCTGTCLYKYKVEKEMALHWINKVVLTEKSRHGIIKKDHLSFRGGDNVIFSVSEDYRS